MGDTNEEFSTAPQNYGTQTYGNTPNQIVQGDPDSRTRFLVEELLKGVRTTMPGIVDSSFERDDAVWLKVQPGVSGIARDGTEITLPIVIAPLARINIAGLEIDIPTPVQGDEVAIVCADRSIATFIKEAGVGIPVTKGILNLSNAWILPVSFSNVKRVRVGEEDRLTIIKDGEKVEFTDSGVIVNEGTRYASGVDDKTLSDNSSDTTFWAFMTNLTTFLTTVSSAASTMAGGASTEPFAAAFGTALVSAIAALGEVPSELTSKITSGSSHLLIPDPETP